MTAQNSMSDSTARSGTFGRMNKNQPGFHPYALLGVAALAALAPVVNAQIYVANYYDPTGQAVIGQYDANTGATLNPFVVITPNFAEARSIAISGSNMFASFQRGFVAEYTTDGDVVNANLITGQNNPFGIAVSGSNIFVVNAPNNTANDGYISEYTTAGVLVNPSLITGLNNPNGIAISGSNIFVTSLSSSTVGEYTTSGATVNAALVTLDPSLAFQPRGIAVAGSNIFVTDFSKVDFSGAVGEYTTSGATVNTRLIGGLDDVPSGIAATSSDLYLTDDNNGRINEYTTAGDVVNSNFITDLDDPAAIALSVSRPAQLVFTGSAGNGTWDIGTTDNFSNAGAATTYADGQPVTFDDTNNTGNQYNITLNAAGATANPGYLSPSSVLVNTANRYTFSGAGIAGTTGLDKAGTGSLTLSASNTYTGTTNISQGSVVLTATGSIANSPITVGITGGTSGTLELQASTSGLLLRKLASLSILNGSAVVDAAATTANRSVLVTSTLSISSVGKLDLNNNDLIVQGIAATVAANLAAVKGYASNGYNAGGWNGSGGIVSTTAATDPTHLTAIGVIQNTNAGSPIYATFDNQPATINDVLVKDTYYGDADLSGTVNSVDYGLIDYGYLSHLTGWYNGDFNYDGTVNGSDYTLIDNAFNTQGAALSSEVAASTEQVTGPSVAAVPEPASLGFIAFCSASLLRRRRKF